MKIPWSSFRASGRELLQALRPLRYELGWGASLLLASLTGLWLKHLLNGYGAPFSLLLAVLFLYVALFVLALYLLAWLEARHGCRAESDAACRFARRRMIASFLCWALLLLFCIVLWLFQPYSA